jgi:hypothetical protein
VAGLRRNTHTFYIYGTRPANNKIVTAAFCGNFLDDLDGPDDPFKVRRPNLDTASKRAEKVYERRF